MTELRVDRAGFVHVGDIRLPLRYIPSTRMVEFAIRDREQRARHGNRVQVPLYELAALERWRCRSIDKD